ALIMTPEIAMKLLRATVSPAELGPCSPNAFHCCHDKSAQPPHRISAASATPYSAHLFWNVHAQGASAKRASKLHIQMIGPPSKPVHRARFRFIAVCRR